MCSMWNAPSDRDYYDQFGAYCDEDEPETCGDCDARWYRGEACEHWCETNRSKDGQMSADAFVRRSSPSFIAGSLRRPQQSAG